jgi:cytoskeletal protein CcmA (bactofilin family)
VRKDLTPVSRSRKVPLDFPKAEETAGVLRNEVLKSRPTFFQRWAAGAPKRNVALQLVRMRAEAGYSQAEVARRAGWDEEFVSRLEEFSGPIPDDAIVARYAAACGRHASPRAAAPNGDVGRRPRERGEGTESVIGADVTIEGTIAGSGHLRIAGSVRGDVQVQGNLTVEPGGCLVGEARANAVIVGGELRGNVEAASQVRLLATGSLTGDMKASSATVAAGSRMRGHMAFGTTLDPMEEVQNISPEKQWSPERA